MFFFNFLFRSALDEFLKIILNATLPILNHYNMNTGKAIVDASVSNNNKPLLVAFISHKCTKPVIWNSYTSSNPNQLNQDPPSTDEIMALSAFLQMCAWPLCVQNVQCEKPMIVHHPDVCIVFRWFKFTLKPPYTIVHGNFLSAIWGIFHWTSFVKFGLKTA